MMLQSPFFQQFLGRVNQHVLKAALEQAGVLKPIDRQGVKRRGVKSSFFNYRFALAGAKKG